MTHDGKLDVNGIERGFYLQNHTTYLAALLTVVADTCTAVLGRMSLDWLKFAANFFGIIVDWREEGVGWHGAEKAGLGALYHSRPRWRQFTSSWSKVENWKPCCADALITVAPSTIIKSLYPIHWRGSIILGLLNETGHHKPGWPVKCISSQGY